MLKIFLNVNMLIMICVSSFSQTGDCDKLLQGGLYSFTNMTNTGSFNSDLRTYFLSDQFKRDVTNNKWGASLSIPIVGDIFSIGANSSDQQWSEWRSKVLAATSLQISSSFYQTAFSSIPNTNLYEAYTRCIEIISRSGVSGFIQGINVETEDAVVFTIYYKPSAPKDPMPKIIDFNVEPQGSVLNGALIPGQKLQGYTVLVTCKRSPEKDLILSLQTDRGSISSKVSALDDIASGKELPVGTIITSYLNFEQFNFSAKNNEKSPGHIWMSQKSKWAPCDGRPVPQSKFQSISNQNNVPDLRGVFLRGLNMFDPYQPVPVKINGDPDNRNNPGIPQDDAFQGFNVSVGNVNTLEHGNSGYHWSKTGDGPDFRTATGKISKGDHGEPRVATETRPKNVTVYYYIKIN